VDQLADKSLFRWKKKPWIATNQNHCLILLITVIKAFFYTQSCDMISHVLLSDSLFFLTINLLSIKFTDIKCWYSFNELSMSITWWNNGSHYTPRNEVVCSIWACPPNNLAFLSHILAVDTWAINFFLGYHKLNVSNPGYIICYTLLVMLRLLSTHHPWINWQINHCFVEGMLIWNISHCNDVQQH
jgi:hypothetical protein